jgi:hypothetical protein
MLRAESSVERPGRACRVLTGFPGASQISAETIENAIWGMRAPCLLDIFKIKE